MYLVPTIDSICDFEALSQKFQNGQGTPCPYEDHGHLVAIWYRRKFQYRTNILIRQLENGLNTG